MEWEKIQREAATERRVSAVIEKKGKWIRSANQNDRIPRDFLKNPYEVITGTQHNPAG